jgi:uncharacterized repeat protein (TIGR03803 family)
MKNCVLADQSVPVGRSEFAMSKIRVFGPLLLLLIPNACVLSQHGAESTPAISVAQLNARVSAVSTAPANDLALNNVAPSPGGHGFKTIYTFKDGPDAAGVQAKMANVGGKLYGTSHGGGTSGNGTVFKIDPKTGVENVIYSFMGGSDGWGPEALLNYYNGMLYGTTSSVPEPGFPDGEGNGTVFAISTTGVEKVLHGFTGSPDGANPEGFVVNVNGTLYGTTFVGGTGTCTYSSSTGCGTVFTVDPTTGSESVLYSFTGGTDGAGPRAGLIDVNGTLYGTTYFGGSSGNGTVFSITPTGSENIIYSFMGGADGSRPQAAMPVVNGVLYGTTNQGGTSGYGTTTAGAEHVIYPVCCGPEGGVIYLNGKLYGTTSDNGSANGGTVFSVTLTGTEQVLHTFTGGANGGSPEAALVNVNGTLYCTTRLGGASGVGTVFKINP